MAIKTLDELSEVVDYSLLNNLNCDPDASQDGDDHDPREVFSGHYVPVNPEPIGSPLYVAHSENLFKSLGLCETLATSEPFIKMFSGDTAKVPEHLHKMGWSCGYALSIYGDEYYQQCPFATGNGYGDGRAISILEGVFGTKRYEMQLKGGGRSPYCRGADGRAVLRSSVREFLAQEHMHGLGISTSRSLTLYVSKTDRVYRPWFHDGSESREPEVMIDEPVAITTRVAPSFLRVGQLELFGRRARKNEHPMAKEELEKILTHALEREYKDSTTPQASTSEKVLTLAAEFGQRLSSLVADWIRVGYCQGNFNSDNCAVGGFTLDYGPFGFMDHFDPRYQPWTGGGLHYSFLNQPQAAQQNYNMLCTALMPLVDGNNEAARELRLIKESFPAMMEEKMHLMWAKKLGLRKLDVTIFNDLIKLMLETTVDYTIFFRELSNIPESIEPLTKSFYHHPVGDDNLMMRWSQWLDQWLVALRTINPKALSGETTASKAALSKAMKGVNPKYILREWHLVSAYQKANDGDYTLIHELQDVMANPYADQSPAIDKKYYLKKPTEFFHLAGVSHVSCSS